MGTIMTTASLTSAFEIGAKALHDQVCLAKTHDWHTGNTALDCIESFNLDAVTVIEAAAPVILAPAQEEIAQLRAQLAAATAVVNAAKRWRHAAGDNQDGTRLIAAVDAWEAGSTTDEPAPALPRRERNASGVTTRKPAGNTARYGHAYVDTDHITSGYDDALLKCNRCAGTLTTLDGGTALDMMITATDLHTCTTAA